MTTPGLVLPFPSRGVLRAAQVVRAPPSPEALQLAASILLVALRRGEAVPPGTVTALLGLLHEHLDDAFAVAVADGLAHVPDREVGLYARGLARASVDNPPRAEIATHLFAGVHAHLVTPPILLMLAERASPVVVAPLAVALAKAGRCSLDVLALLIEAWRHEDGDEAHEAIRLVEVVLALPSTTHEHRPAKASHPRSL